MKWKNILPYIRGYYWIRESNGWVEIVYAEVGERRVYHINETGPTPFEKLTGVEWYGPLEEPD